LGHLYCQDELRQSEQVLFACRLRNADPKPYIWRAEGAAILAKIKRARAALDRAEAA
jgi:hypothetical protein